MNLEKIRLIVWKEFEEIMKNKLILGSILLTPLIFAFLLPTAMFMPAILSPGELTSNETTRMISNLPGVAGMSAQEGYFAFMTMALLPFFMMLPAILPTIISAYSIVGEKKNRTLEPLLAAPVSVDDIMIGKTLAALIPALAGTWISAAIFAILVWAMTHNIVHRILVPDLTWLICLFILGPLIAFFGVMLTVVISSRVNDPRVAQQFSIVLLLPILAISMAQFTGLLLVNANMILVICAVIAGADVILVQIGGQLFDREEILTHWK